ncbi:hypothetical protein TIFTF001_032748 [Ficus carica]|uniref:Uncharacterized protein n=1 Tax=Ficus carica TaxID=3494 RepID=A0AA88E404_FICCA|nr:hypothetical protein TIFTF001_032748 [Ficus carica]
MVSFENASKVETLTPNKSIKTMSQDMKMKKRSLIPTLFEIKIPLTNIHNHQERVRERDIYRCRRWVAENWFGLARWRNDRCAGVRTGGGGVAGEIGCERERCERKTEGGVAAEKGVASGGDGLREREAQERDGWRSCGEGDRF